MSLHYPKKFLVDCWLILAETSITMPFMSCDGLKMCLSHWESGLLLIH